MQLIKRLRAEHRFAVFMVTHDRDMLYALTDVAVLGDRHIIACGTQEEVGTAASVRAELLRGERGRRALVQGETAA